MVIGKGEQLDLIRRVNELDATYRRLGVSYGLVGAMAYHTPVAWVEKGRKTKWRYGVEFEIDLSEIVLDVDHSLWVGGLEYVRRIISHVLHLRLDDHEGGVTRDNSIPAGAEIVLVPMTRKEIISHLGAVMNDRHVRPFLKDSDNAALHVTVDPFDTIEQQRAFHRFWNDDSFFRDFASVTGRQENGYVKRRERARYKPDGWMRQDTVNDHYYRCCVRHNGAMEVRVFKAVYDERKIKEQLDLVHKVNKLVRDGVGGYENIKKRI